MSAKTKSPETPEASAEPELNGVLVNVTSDGNLSVQVLGEIKATEASTILRLAAKNVDQQFGLD